MTISSRESDYLDDSLMIRGIEPKTNNSRHNKSKNEKGKKKKRESVREIMTRPAKK